MRRSGVFAIVVSEEASLQMEKLLPKAMDGEFDVLCNLLLYLSAAIKQRVPLTPRLANFLADALLKIADGGDPKKAFHIHRGRGKRNTREARFRALCWVHEVKMLRSIDKRMSVEAAIGQVAEAEEARSGGKHEHAIRAAWRDFREAVQLSEKDPYSAFIDLTPRATERHRRRA